MGRSSLILGASGAIGRHCLGFMIASERYDSVTAVGRRALDFEHRKLKQKVVDFENLDAGSVVGDDVFSCFGTTIRAAGSRENFRKIDFEIPLKIAKAAKLNGALRFSLVSSVGADPKSGNFYLRTKGELEEALKEVGFEELRIFRPSLLLA